MNNLGLNIGFDTITYTWKRYIKIIGVDFNNERFTRTMRFLNTTTFALLIILIYQFIVYIVYSDADMKEKSPYFSNVCFCLACLGRLLTFVVGKNDIMQCIERFHNIYPSITNVERYNLQGFISQFRRIELVLLTSMHSATLFYWLAPILLAFLRYMFKGENFQFSLLYDLYYPSMIYESWLPFLAIYMLQMIATYAIVLIIFSSDFCLFSLLIQLCMHFNLIGQRIREIDADEENAEENLKKQVLYHNAVLELCDVVNRIFAPCLTFNLLITCFILCMNGFELLDDLPIHLVIRTIFLLAYEFNHVALTCYYGEKLVENSELLFFQLYDHNWYDGSKRYKKMVLIAMDRMRYPSALNVAKISDLNLETLKFVLTNSYRVFTVLKASK